MKKDTVNYGRVISFFVEKVKAYKYRYIMLVLFVAIINIIMTIYPIIFKNIIDLASQSNEKGLIINNIIPFVYIFISLSFCSFILRRVVDIIHIVVQTNCMRDIGQELFKKILSQSYRYFTNNFSGALVKKINRLIDSYERITDIFIYEIIRFVVSLLFILIILFFHNIYIGLIFFTYIVLFIFITYFFNKNRKTYYQDSVEKESKFSGSLADVLTNTFNITIFGTSKREDNYLRVEHKTFIDALKKSWFIFTFNYAILGLITMISEIAILVAGIYFWYHNYITIGTLVLLINYQLMSMNILFGFSHIYRNINTIFGDASEGVDLLDDPVEIIDKNNAKNIEIKSGKIEFKDVVFEYNSGKPVFNGIDLVINPGEKVAFVGASGSGKSTMIKLILRLFDIQGGQILIDNQNISEVTQQSLRSSIALVPQEPILFHRTLRENIKYSNPNISEEEFLEISKLSHCDRFISKLSEKYDTLVGERGIKLSGGEKQRVAIARALLSGNKIILFDEATSSLDSESESLIQDSLEYLMKDKTAIFIAHRLSTIMKMDRIIVFDSGKIVEQGSHTELISRENGYYKKLWEIQSGGFI